MFDSVTYEEKVGIIGTVALIAGLTLYEPLQIGPRLIHPTVDSVVSSYKDLRSSVKSLFVEDDVPETGSLESKASEYDTAARYICLESPLEGDQESFNNFYSSFQLVE